MKRFSKTFRLLPCLVLAFAACDSEDGDGGEDTTVNPSVTVADQAADPANEVVVAEVVSDGAGFLVIHESDDSGNFGVVIGNAAVTDGTNTNVKVTLDRDAVDGETLWAMLHVDATADGGPYDGAADAPVTVEGDALVNEDFTVTVEDQIVPSITAEDQTLTDATKVTVKSVTSDGPGHIAIHADDAGTAGEVVGLLEGLESGTSTDVEVTLFAATTDGTVLHAMLHIDANGDGKYDAADDGPAVTGTGIVNQPFTVTVP